MYADGKQLPSYAVCSCGAYFPKCDLEDARIHINPKSGVTNHSWVFIHKDWIEICSRWSTSSWT